MALCLVAVVVSLSAVAAAVTPVPIEGTILVTASSTSVPIHTYFIEGMSDNVLPSLELFAQGEISPYMDRVAYNIRNTYPETATDIWTARLDGSDAINVSALAGLEGVNCNVAWSPDSTMIAFQHADPAVPTGSAIPCEIGWHVWVVNADGTGAHQVTAPGSPPSWSPTWSPNGHRLLCWLSSTGALTINADGTSPTLVPNVADMADWSPDGTTIVSVLYEEGMNGGEPGLWRRLWLANADGTNLRVLYERFVSDADVAVHLALYESLLPPSMDHAAEVREGVGPTGPKWSPLGNRILFRAAIPFDPAGPFYGDQVELWVYDLDAGELVRLTENEMGEWDHSWDGDNTLPTDTEVTVGEVTVAFPEVVAPGVTTIVIEGDPPALSETYLSVGECYEVATTAEVSGLVGISMGYADGSVPATAEGHLKLLRYDEGAAQWRDITVSRDFTSHVIHGETTALGLMGLAWPLPASDFSDVSGSATDPFWALWEIQAAYDAGIVQGYPGGTYHPAEAVSRAQMAVYVSRALAGGDAGVPPAPPTISFPDDVPSTHWAYRYVEYAAEAGVVQGYDATHYRPDGVVDRGQMTVFVARAKDWVSIGEAMNTAPQLFSDVPAGFWSGTAIAACRDHGVVKGYADGTYHPERQVTRDQMAVYVARAFELPM